MMEKCLFHFFSIEFPNILNAKIGFKWIGCVQQSITLHCTFTSIILIKKQEHYIKCRVNNYYDIEKYFQVEIL